MKKEYTKEELEKAYEQADANLNFEEVNLIDIIKKETKSKVLKKELKK